MSAERIVTTMEKFDEMGKLVERITTEEFPKEKTCECTKNRRKATRRKRKALRFLEKYFIQKIQQ